MYDLIIVKKLNKKKIVICILLLILIIAIPIVSGIKFAQYKKQQAEKLLAEHTAIMLAEIEKQKQKELAKQAEIQERINKTSNPLTEEQQNNILYIYRSTGNKRVFLTFDDGPSKSVTPLILDVLKEQNVKATFFTLGNNVKYYPELVKRAFDEGHYIANHGYSHKYSEVYSSPEATLAEYNWTEQAIKDALGNQNYHSNLFRFPGGSNGGYYNDAKQNSKALLKENGIVHLDWNCLTRDSEGVQTKESLLQNAIDTASEKDSIVILMHDSSDKILTYEVLPELIQYFRDRGYEFQNIYDLL